MPIGPLYTKLVLPLNQNLGAKSLFASLECRIDGRADRGLLCLVWTVVFPVMTNFRLSLVKHNHVFCPPHLVFLSGPGATPSPLMVQYLRKLVATKSG